MFKLTLCTIGMHKWNQTRPIALIDGFPPPNVKYTPPKRTCKKCGKRERWLPGYGGSEWGCWIDEN